MKREPPEITEQLIKAMFSYDEVFECKGLLDLFLKFAHYTGEYINEQGFDAAVDIPVDNRANFMRACSCFWRMATVSMLYIQCANLLEKKTKIRTADGEADLKRFKDFLVSQIDEITPLLAGSVDKFISFKEQEEKS